MTDDDKCPVCRSVNDSQCQVEKTSQLTIVVDCEICGRFTLHYTTAIRYFDADTSPLTQMQRASLSHQLRTASQASAIPSITLDWLERFLADSALPSPAIQAINIIRFVGDEVSRTGEPVKRFPIEFHAVIGSPNRDFAGRLVKELCSRGILTSMSSIEMLNVDLTLDGWDSYEAEQRGEIAGKYGFIAMKFNDPVLDPFVEDVVKPAVKDGIGYELVHMRNVAQAGIIDNIMRAQIRDAAFVIVDLTHDNSGAYWEAGYAEGLGKPVIYICERTKFEAVKTHFDTNHCTTVVWSEDGGDNFAKELVATLRRSLNLFPESAR